MAVGALTTKFKYERSTKSTHRYNEVADEPIIGALYIKKTAFGEVAPESLTVTVKIDAA